MTPTALREYLIFATQNKFNVLVKGKPGIGKTQIIIDVANELGADLILSHPVISDPTDYKGWPFERNGEANFLPFGDMRKLINADRLTICFIDDIGQAPPTVQAALMQVIWGGKIAGHTVSPHVRFVGATNRKEDKAAVSGLIEPVKSRFASIIELEVSVEDWILWGINNGMPTELLAFNRFRPNLMDSFVPSKDIVNGPCPRTVANLGLQQAAGLPQKFEFEVFSGAVGQAYAAEYCAFLEMYRNMPNTDAIIANPKGAPIPTEPAILYGLSGALAHRMNDTNIGAIVTYIERLPGEMQAVCMKDATTRKPQLANTRDFIRFASGPVGKTIFG